MMRTMRADLVGVSVLPVAQLVAQHGDDLVLRQVLKQVVVEQNAVDAEEAVRRSVAVARSLATVDHLNAADAEADALRQLVNAVAERRGLHRRHLVEQRHDDDRIQHVQNDGKDEVHDPGIHAPVRSGLLFRDWYRKCIRAG